MSIFVVDDERDLREYVCEALCSEGYETLQASNGKDALELIRRTRELPQLILLDVTMPIMDGWEFLLQIDEDLALHRIPVALMSAHPSVRRAFEDEGAIRTTTRLLLPKPLDMDRLVATVHHVCRGEAEV
jgi:two-component system response regulator (stage 0 sporulation protein F)